MCVVDTLSDGEGDFVEDFAGEEPGQPKPTGKPPLDLASMYLLYYAFALVYKIALFRWYRRCPGHSDTTP